MNTWRRAAVLLIAVALAAWAGAGCSSHPGATTPAPVTSTPYPPPRPQSLDGLTPAPAAPPPPADASPDAVATAGLGVMFTWDTGRDSGPATATRRALAYLAPPMSIDVIAAPPVASPGAQWGTWAAHHAVLTPTITAGSDDTPPATARRAYRQYEITQNVHSSDGWTAPPEHRTAFVTLVRTPAGWRIANVTQS